MKNFREVWSRVLTCCVRVISSRRLLLFKRVFPVSWKVRAKNWLLWCGQRAVLGNASSRLGVARKLPSGINVFGYLEAPTGLGAAARSSIRAMQAVGLPVVGIPISEQELASGLPSVRAPQGQCYAVNWCHLNASEAPALVSVFGPLTFAQHFNIGYWVWELPSIPQTWELGFRYYDEIWVPTTFVQRAVAAKAPIPVQVIPHPIEPCPSGSDLRPQLSIPPKAKVFLCMFDMGSSVERKNPLASIRAFKRACKGRTDVYLLLKTSRPEINPAAWEELRAELEGVPHRIINQPLQRVEIWDLISACDAVLSLHRSEGFGLVIAEGMAMGKPAIATGYSGNMDFMNGNNSYPVNYRLVKLEKSIFPFPAGGIWAEPDMDHAIEQIQLFLKDNDRAMEMGARAARDVAEHLSPRKVGTMIRSRLESLAFNFEGR